VDEDISDDDMEAFLEREQNEASRREALLVGIAAESTRVSCQV
jgi:hypothetical protein